MECNPKENSINSRHHTNIVNNNNNNLANPSRSNTKPNTSGIKEYLLQQNKQEKTIQTHKKKN